MAFDRAPNLLPGTHGQRPLSCLEMNVTTTAILVDGNYYLRRARKLWGDKSPEERADELHDYALKHITHSRDMKIEIGKRSLYRIFYYDCPPLMEGSVHQPWDGKTRGFSKRSPSNQWSSAFQSCLGTKRKVAMRMGTLAGVTDRWARQKAEQAMDMCDAYGMWGMVHGLGVAQVG